MRNIQSFLAIAICCVLAPTAARLAAQSVPTSDTYAWSGELVSFDANSRAITVKSYVTGESVGQFAEFKPGDRIVLTWSGNDEYAMPVLSRTVSRAVRYDAAVKWNEPFTFPVEFVAFGGSPGKYVTFKVQVPTSSVDTLRSVKPGEWVTATSKQRASNEAEAITAVKAYTASTSRTGTN